MRKWGSRSLAVHAQLTPNLQWVMDTLLKEAGDISLVCGHRNEQEQNALYPKYSKVKWPNGKHNSMPSRAVDFQPYPYPSDDKVLWASLAYYAGRAIEIGKSAGITLRWGGDWNGDGNMVDTEFYDLFHLEETT